MPLYTARVRVARPATTSGDSGLIWQEIMVDSVQAKGEKKAKAKAVEEANRWQAYAFQGMDDVLTAPTPEVLDIARLKADGTPVRGNFSKGNAKVTMKCSTTPALPPPKTEVKTTVKTEVKKAVSTGTVWSKAYSRLDDPFTKVLIEAISEGSTGRAKKIKGGTL